MKKVALLVTLLLVVALPTYGGTDYKPIVGEYIEEGWGLNAKITLSSTVSLDEKRGLFVYTYSIKNQSKDAVQVNLEFVDKVVYGVGFINFIEVGPNETKDVVLKSKNEPEVASGWVHSFVAATKGMDVYSAFLSSAGVLLPEKGLWLRIGSFNSGAYLPKRAVAPKQ